ncbi:MAG: hypothetical protein PHR06_11925, partial [Candidatus Cloacimonetes bacterium]|nr:hypothetical protein [Candidatus Cloacimonadota bacterium]
MESLKKEVLYQRLRDMFDFAIPCIIISK